MNPATERPEDEARIDQLSPELALVDAELAAVARSRMPDHPGVSAAALSEPAGRVRGPRAESAALDEPEPPQSEQQPRTLRTAIASRGSDPSAGTVVSGDERSMTARVATRGRVAVGAGPSAASLSREEALDETPASSDRLRARRSVSRLPALIAGVLLSLAGVAVAAIKMTGDQGATDRVGTPAAVANPDASPAEAWPTTNGRRPTPASAAKPPRAKARPAPGRPTRRRRSSAPASAASSPAPVFVWLPVRGASHYRVEFFRSGRKVFAATTSQARLELPRRWRFEGRRFKLTRGSYRWLVRPGFGPRSNARYGAAIVSSRWIFRT